MKTMTSRRMMRMKISQKGIDLIKEYEGCSLTSYQDAVGVWTISYGITSADKSVTGTTIKKGMKISQATADKWLVECLDKIYAPKVMKYNDIYHWNQNQFDALMSFCYNIGSIDQLTDNGTRSIKTIAEKILAYNKAGGKVLKGLVRRREAEHKLFCKPTKNPYPGKFPALPKRGYFKYGDGIYSNMSYQTDIKRVQKIVNWVMDFNLSTDGKYGEKTDKAVTKMQQRFGLSVNGCFGNKCLKVAKDYRK